MDRFDGRYELKKVLGEGGMGIVWRAWDTRRQRWVALKQMLPERAQGALEHDLFDREFHILSSLDVAGVPRALDRGCVGGLPYFTMQLVEGRPLDEHLRRERLDWRGAARLVIKAALRLDAIHRAGFVHGDVKPSNILIDGRGTPWWIDFGIGSPQDAAMLPEESEYIYGTLAYLPAERIADDPALRDHRSDQYSLAVILHEVLAGRQPFVGRSSTELMKRIETEPPPALHRSARRGIPVALSDVVARALSKRPEDRFRSVRAFALAAHRAIGPERELPEPAVAALAPCPARRSGPVGDRIQRILVPLDGTREAERALGQVLPIASRTGASILLLHVLDGVRAGANARLADREFVPTRVGAYLRDRRALIREMGHAAEILVEEGDTVEQILAVSESRGIDLIAMSSNRDGLPDAARLGPVVAGLLERGAVSMLIVPPLGDGWLVDLTGIAHANEAGAEVAA